MAKFCINCGHELPEGMTFCPECGAKAEGASSAPRPAAEPWTASAYASAAPAPAAAAKDPETGVVSTGGFWGLHLLYKLPVIGFICSLVLSIAPRNRNLRHHALANFIWKLLGIAFFITLLILARPALQKARDAFNDAFQSFSQSQAAGSMDVNDMVQQFMSGDVDGFMEQFGGGYAYPAGGEESMEDVLSKFGVGSLGELLQKYQAGEITDADLAGLE